jgi:hypothetical protein
MASIRITKVPAGEAPEEIRRAWVGLVLPLADDEARRENFCSSARLEQCQVCVLRDDDPGQMKSNRRRPA